MESQIASGKTPERVDIFDETFKRLGSMTKEDAHLKGAWHQSVHCWIVNRSSPPALLFQLRSPRAAYFPGRLDITAAGHVSAGETKKAVLREVEEELKVTPQYKNLVNLGVKIEVGRDGSVVNREFAHVFLWERSQPVKEYRPNPVEVAGLFEIPLDEGIRFFSGKRRSLEVSGMVWTPDSAAWREDRRVVSVNDFVPRIDRYYLRVFGLADRLLRGERHLAI